MRYTGTPGRAALVLEKALKVAPEDTRLMAELGKVRIATGRPHQAVELLDKALSLGEADWRSYAALGIANDHIGERMQALQAYEAAQVLSPENVAIINNMALSAALAGDMEEGTRLLERAATLPGATAQVRQNLALLYGVGGKLVAAERLARLDLPPELVARNLAYYREMRDGVQQRDLGLQGMGGTQKHYVIEVGPYATAQQAIKGWRSISSLDTAYSRFKVEIVSRRIGQRPMTEYLAAAGPFPSREGAKNACSKLQARNLMCWVVRQ
jgi:tetratricopeptide (TPR) repeat protein